MFFFLFILALILFISWPILRVLFAVKNATNRARQAFAGQQQQQRQAQAQPRVRKKIFTRDDGEYVDYEEISAATASSPSDTTSRYDNFTPEPQISDAEWEDIK